LRRLWDDYEDIQIYDEEEVDDHFDDDADNDVDGIDDDEARIASFEN